MIVVIPSIALDEREIEERFVRASGPGGQNVNKLATAVQLRFDVERSPALPEGVRARLKTLAGGGRRRTACSSSRRSATARRSATGRMRWTASSI